MPISAISNLKLYNSAPVAFKLDERDAQIYAIRDKLIKFAGVNLNSIQSYDKAEVEAQAAEIANAYAKETGKSIDVFTCYRIVDINTYSGGRTIWAVDLKNWASSLYDRDVRA